MKNIFLSNGISLEIHSTIVEQQTKFSMLDDDFNNKFTSEIISKGHADRVNLYFIEDYSYGSYCGTNGCLGNSAGIPGSIGQKGKHNGVLISLKAHEKDDGSGLNSQLLAETSGHEMGHFLGLFHPNEKYGTLFDPIEDTPECSKGYSSADLCGLEYGADNLMFWNSWSNGNQDNLTEGQVYVLKRALIAK